MENRSLKDMLIRAAQRYAHQSKTLEAHVPPPQNHVEESVSACI